MTEFNEKAINEILLKAIITRGFEVTFEQIVFSFLNRVGIMWHTGSVDVGAEHFVSNIFRKRLIAAIDALPHSENPGRKKAILFLPENELHELGLLFFAFVVAKAGYEVVYLGQSTPFNAMADVAERWHADILITGTLTGLPVGKPEEYLARLSNAFSGRKILVSGALVPAAVKKAYANVFAVNSLNDLKRHL